MLGRMGGEKRPVSARSEHLGVQPPDRLSMGLRHQVAVEVERHLDRSVTELPLDILRVFKEG